MAERKIFSQEEVKYISEAIDAFGCCSAEDPNRPGCPYGARGLKDGEGNLRSGSV